jgi:hypothetical protein
VPIVIPLAGIGVFWLLSDSRVPAAVTWGVLAGCGLVSLVAACAGVIAGAAVPRWTAVLLSGWVLLLFIVSVLFAAGCLYLGLKVGDHIGSANHTRATIIATGLGAAIGAIAVIVYDVLPNIGYGWFAQLVINSRYLSHFPAESPRSDQGFLAGRSAVTDPGGGSVYFPADWEVPGSNQPLSQEEEMRRKEEEERRRKEEEERRKKEEEEKEKKKNLRTVLIDGWTVAAVRHRLTLIQLALPVPSDPSATVIQPVPPADPPGRELSDGGPSPAPPGGSSGTSQASP